MKLNELKLPPIQSLQSFCSAAGFAEITAWRLRKKGWLKTVNINGRQYITAEQVAEFLQRAEAGEFAAVHKTPAVLVRGHGLPQC